MRRKKEHTVRPATNQMRFPGISCTFQIINKEEDCLLLQLLFEKSVGGGTCQEKPERAALVQPWLCCINPFITNHLVNDGPVSLASFDPTAVHQPKRGEFSCSLVSYAELLPIVGPAEWQLADQDKIVHEPALPIPFS